MKLLKIMLCVLAIAASSLSCATEMLPDALVKLTSQDVLAIVKQDKDIQSGNQKKIYELVDAKVLPHFDFTRMTTLAVGRYWKTATPAQQQALAKEFRTLLVRTYSSSLAAYKNQTIEYKPLQLQSGDTDVTVKTQVIQPGGQPIPIDYSMEKTAAGWKVYDITVDGVSLVINYRSSFANEIRQSGIDGLVKVLVNKNQGGVAANVGAKK